MAIGDSPIEEALMNFQSLVRSEQIENAKEAARASLKEARAKMNYKKTTFLEPQGLLRTPLV